jgi:diguanylate cyclase (GGDEF)-like protein
VLVESAKLLKQGLREQDSLARWGGEEFLILLPETDAEGAYTLAERLRLSIQDRVFEYRKCRVTVTVTQGVCEYHNGISVDDAIRKADNALYEGKQLGRNCVMLSETADLE